MKTWTRLRSPALWGLALVLGAPALVQAQQSGLFPLAPIRRERVPCPMEDPVYRLYRQAYFGYHPTCWRRFPPGWGCPSPDAPNPAAEFKERPLQKPTAPPADELGEPGPAPDNMPEDETAPPSGGRPPRQTPAPGGNLPPVPSENRSPFELDTEPKPAPGPRAESAPSPRIESTAPAAAAESTLPGPSAESTVPGPSAGSSLELPQIESAKPELESSGPAESSPSASNTSPVLPDVPALDDPLGTSIASPKPAESPSANSAIVNGLPANLPPLVETPSASEGSRPALEMPEASPPNSDLTSVVAPQPQPPATSTPTTVAARPIPSPNGPSVFNNPSDNLTMPPSAPVQAPQRQSFIGRIFNRFRR